MPHVNTLTLAARAQKRKQSRPAAAMPRLRASVTDIMAQILAALLINMLSLAFPILMLQVYDRIIPHRAYGTLVMLIVGVGIALLLDAALRLMRAWLTGWSAAKQDYAANCAAMESFQRADLRAFEKNEIGTHLQNIGALTRLRDFYSGQALSAIVDLPFVFLFLGLIVYLGGKLAIIPAGLLLLFLISAGLSGIVLRRALERRSGEDDRKTNFIVSILHSIHSVKALAVEAFLLRRFEERQADVSRASYRVAQASGLSATLGALFSQLALILTASFGAFMVLKGGLSIGGLSACTLLAGRTIQPAQRVLGTWLRMQDFVVARKQAEQLFALPKMARSRKDLPQPQGSLVLHHVDFSYDDDRILRDVSLTINPGDVVAIQGGKGSGKSTLLQMMAGLLTPVSGTVTLDGINPAHFALGALRRHIGYLPHEGAIFRGSVLDNMTGFDNSDDVVAQAKTMAKHLQLDRIINLLPRGYDTMLMDNNADPIPPGVKQRVALVRVLLHQPALLLFDAADRALDKEGYNSLFRMVGQMKKQCSIVLVSEDQNLLSFADRFYILEKGSLFAQDNTAAQKLVFLSQAKQDQEIF